MKKRYVPRKRKTTSRALQTRGGFTPSNPTLRAATKLAQQAARAALKNADPSSSLGKVATVMKALDAPTAINIGNAVKAGMQGHYEGGAVNTGRNELPSMTMEDQKNRMSGSVGYTSKLYTTKHYSGRPITKTAKDMAKIQGTSDIVLADTARSQAYTGVARTVLSRNSGFNRKEVLTYRDLHFTAGDLIDTFSASAYDEVSDKIEQAYMMIGKMYQDVEIMNTNSYFPAKVSIKMYRPTSPERTVGNAIVNAVTTSDPDDVTNQGDGIPIRYQFTLPETAVQGTLDAVKIDPRASLDLSPEFSRRFQKIKQFSKTLKPGDVWRFCNTVSCGPGVRLDMLHDIWQAGSNAMVGDLILIEHHGVRCEAVEKTNDNYSHIGSSPTNLQIKWKKGMTVTRRNQFSNSAFYAATALGGGVLGSQYAIRAFEKNEAINELSDEGKLYNTSIITDKADAGTLGVYIPVITDSTISYAEPQRDKDD